jgi:hypothetical protein
MLPIPAEKFFSLFFGVIRIRNAAEEEGKKNKVKQFDSLCAIFLILNCMADSPHTRRVNFVNSL